MAIPMQGNGTGLEAGLPQLLFQLPALPPAADRYATSIYAAAPDGQRFLVRVLAGPVMTPPATVVLNWAEGLKK